MISRLGLTLGLCRKVGNNVPRMMATSTCLQNQSAPASNAEFKWDLVSAVCLERVPFITPSMTPLETKMKGILDTVEYEESLLSDHEVRHKQDLERLEKKKRGEVDPDSEALITALDLEDAWKKESAEFVAAPRTTEADRINDVKSIQRFIDRPLRLVFNYKKGDFSFWDLPSAIRVDGETMRDAAERALTELTGQQLPFQILGNAPLAFYKYKYPRKYRDMQEREGAKVFVFKGYLTAGYLDHVHMSLDKQVINYQWATRDEMEKLVQPKIFKTVSLLFHEDS